MGFDAGFDMVPQLTRTATDSRDWEIFIAFLKEHYRDSKRILIKPNCLLFKVGKHPIIPVEGHKFLHFSSKISGKAALDSGIKDYINTVTQITKIIFGGHVQY
ncbi:hypothetical protein BGZ63DRAFT_408854 [Mariannaea sp. PMI_226]|nr:hypothetical protein BGZ63DRAFT_408854 [Mariannaea sp. PMI_226]